MSKDLNLSDDYLGASPYEPASQGSKHYCVELGKRSFEVKDWTEEQATAFIHEAEALAKQAKLEHGEHYASGDECSDLIDLIQKCVDSGYDLVHPEDASLDVHKASLKYCDDHQRCARSVKAYFPVNVCHFADAQVRREGKNQGLPMAPPPP